MGMGHPILMRRTSVMNKKYIVKLSDESGSA